MSDPTSFQNILANVKRLRGEHSGAEAETASPSVVPKSVEKPPVKPTNAFNPTEAYKQFNANDKRPVQQSASNNAILVSKSQTGNPLLKDLTNTSWRYVDSRGIVYDYNVQNRNVVFLSLKYHKLHPEYIVKKMKPLSASNRDRTSAGNILLCVVDVEQSDEILRYVNKLCLFNGFQLLLAFNFNQAAKYLIYLNK